jgi:ubiquinone/menaquinone biosynthesis C-methylase UbiE
MRAQNVTQQHTAGVVKDLIDLLPSGGRVLDLGCGPGFHALALAQGGLSVTALDYSEGMLDRARQNAESENASIQFRRADLATSVWVEERAYDGALCVSVFQIMRQPGIFLERVGRSLRPGGYLLIELSRAGKRIHSQSDSSVLPLSDRLLNGVKPLVAHLPGLLQRYDPPRLRSLLEARGFRTVDEHIYESTFTVLSRSSGHE